ncbi:transposase, partial [Phytoactinopolyspora limicola]|uniref:transposase n=1 Tax=Phytoactinopolyspora limicola TaxID=2715536 RepID=UPI001A9C2E17
SLLLFALVLVGVSWCLVGGALAWFGVMAKGYRRVDREQAFLLPPSMTDWLPDDHVVWFVIEAVDQMDTSAFHARAKLGSTGRAGYDPDMLLTLWVFAMAHGVTSSRQIERLCTTDVAFRIICASDVPDHTVLARFRSAHEQALEDLLTESLVLATKLGMIRLGVLALDGTKIKANAAKRRNYSEKYLRGLAREHLRQAAADDEAEDALFGEHTRGDELPQDLRDRTGRGGRIQQALQELDERRRADEAEMAAEQAKAEEYIVRLADPRGAARPRDVHRNVSIRWTRPRPAWTGPAPGNKPASMTGRSAARRQPPKGAPCAVATRNPSSKQAGFAGPKQTTTRPSPQRPPPAPPLSAMRPPGVTRST